MVRVGAPAIMGEGSITIVVLAMASRGPEVCGLSCDREPGIGGVVLAVGVESGCPCGVARGRGRDCGGFDARLGGRVVLWLLSRGLWWGRLCEWWGVGEDGRGPSEMLGWSSTTVDQPRLPRGSTIRVILRCCNWLCGIGGGIGGRVIV